MLAEVNKSSWTSSFNDLETFDPVMYYGSTDMSTTPSMTTPSIENGTAHNPNVLTDAVFDLQNLQQLLKGCDHLAMKFKTCQIMLWELVLNKIDVLNFILAFF